MSGRSDLGGLDTERLARRIEDQAARREFSAVNGDDVVSILRDLFEFEVRSFERVAISDGTGRAITRVHGSAFVLRERGWL